MNEKYLNYCFRAGMCFLFYILIKHLEFEGEGNLEDLIFWKSFLWISHINIYLFAKIQDETHNIFLYNYIYR